MKVLFFYIYVHTIPKKEKGKKSKELDNLGDLE